MQSKAYKSQLQALRISAEMTELADLMKQFDAIPGVASAAAKFMKSGGKSKPSIPPPTSFGEDDADTTPTSASSAIAAGSGAAFSAAAATLAATAAKKSGASKRKKAADAKAVDPAKTALVNANIAKAAADRAELHMCGPIVEGASSPDERIQHPLIGFSELGPPHTIDITSKLSPTALALMRPKGSEAAIHVKIQLYAKTVKYFHDSVIPYITEKTMFQLTQFPLSPDEWSPKFFVDIGHREYMRVRGTAEDETEHDVFGCRLSELIAYLRRLEVFGKKAYSVFVGAERKSTLFLKKEGLVSLVKELETLWAPYNISALHADAHKPAAALADDIDKAVDEAFVPEAVAPAAAASAPAPVPRFAAAPAAAKPQRVATAPVKAAATTTVATASPKKKKDQMDSDSDTEEASAAALATLAAASAAAPKAVAPPAPKAAVRNTPDTAVFVEDDSEPQEVQESAPKRLRPTAPPPAAPTAVVHTMDSGGGPAAELVTFPSSKDEKVADETAEFAF